MKIVLYILKDYFECCTCDVVSLSIQEQMKLYLIVPLLRGRNMKNVKPIRIFILPSLNLPANRAVKSNVNQMELERFHIIFTVNIAFGDASTLAPTSQTWFVDLREAKEQWGAVPRCLNTLHMCIHSQSAHSSRFSSTYIHSAYFAAWILHGRKESSWRFVGVVKIRVLN